MASFAREATQIFDDFFEQHKKLESEVNRLSREQALQEPDCYSAVENLSHQQAKALSELVDHHGRDALIPILHEHPLHCYILLQSAFIRHALEKPFGYAGDKDLMLMICSKEDRGDTNYAILQNRVYLNLPAAEAVRQRILSLFQVLSNLPEGSHVLNLACGPALEVGQFLKQFPDRSMRFDLVDHDLNTLGYIRQVIEDARVVGIRGNAYRIMQGDYQVLIPEESQESSPNTASDLNRQAAPLIPLTYAKYTLSKDEYDLVYASGLFDYIESCPRDNQGPSVLAKQLFQLVRPGGSLIIGNYLAVSDDNPHKKHHRTMMELYSKWDLIYRSPGEIREFMQDVPPDAYSMRLTDEYLSSSLKGAIGFLFVSKN